MRLCPGEEINLPVDSKCACEDLETSGGSLELCFGRVYFISDHLLLHDCHEEGAALL